MKKALKIIFYLLTAHTLTSCEKSEEVKPQTWYLTFNSPALGYSCQNLPVHSIMDNMGADGKKVGLCLDFEDESFLCRIFMENGNVTQFTGVYEGEAFGVHGNTINICNGTQGGLVTYNLKFE